MGALIEEYSERKSESDRRSTGIYAPDSGISSEAGRTGAASGEEPYCDC